jgi:hypothetical protein
VDRASSQSSHQNSHGAIRLFSVIRVYDEAGNLIETHEHAGDFREWSMPFLQPFDGYFPLAQSFSVMVTLVR